ncbi:MAG: hypothetical protein SFU25_03530 [Candidatus Caenarcaniphilales bacterium]|nr:hypothetical protein [Candidatus Caenarcaniphilales bacterium]
MLVTPTAFPGNRNPLRNFSGFKQNVSEKLGSLRKSLAQVTPQAQGVAKKAREIGFKTLGFGGLISSLIIAFPKAALGHEALRPIETERSSLEKVAQITCPGVPPGVIADCVEDGGEVVPIQTPVHLNTQSADFVSFLQNHGLDEDVIDAILVRTDREESVSDKFARTQITRILDLSSQAGLSLPQLNNVLRISRQSSGGLDFTAARNAVGAHLPVPGNPPSDKGNSIIVQSTTPQFLALLPTGAANQQKRFFRPIPIPNGQNGISFLTLASLSNN